MPVEIISTAAIICVVAGGGGDGRYNGGRIEFIDPYSCGRVCCWPLVGTSAANDSST